MNWLLDYSYVGIAVFLALTGCGLPVPEEVGIIAAGVFSSKGTLNPWLALAACIIGCVVGDSAMYWIGHHFGRRLLHGRGFWAKLLTPERERELEKKIKSHGFQVFLLARFLVGVRGPLYLTAGILKVPFRRFLIIDVIAATIVVSIFFALSYFVGDVVIGWIREAEEWLTIVVGIGVVVGGIVLYLNRKRIARLAKSALEHVPHPHLKQREHSAADGSLEQQAELNEHAGKVGKHADVAALPTSATAANNGEAVDDRPPGDVQQRQRTGDAAE